MLLADLAQTSARVADTAARLEKTALLADCVGRAAPDEVPLVVAYLGGDTPQGKLGVGHAGLREAWPSEAARESSLTVREVDEAFSRLASLAGPGSKAEKMRVLSGLFGQATAEEQTFLGGIVMGELRQGALEGVLVEALAKAARVPAGAVRRALMLSGDLGLVASRALSEGKSGLARLSVQLFRPVQPMLAQSADDVGLALEQVRSDGGAELEFKLDGARIQVHKRGDEVRVFTRKLNEVTEAVPEVVEQVRGLPARELILDGEVLALRPDGWPLPFQTTMRRFGRKLDVAALRAELPLSPFFFDCLLLDGDGLLDEPTGARLEALIAALPAELVIPRLVTSDPHQAQAFLERARGAGHEGLMVKDLGARYQAGRRGQSWVKVKPTHTLDLVVLAAEWGHGRRKGWLSNLHLGARDPSTGGFVMLGKTFKGLTDATLAWQTEQLQALAVDHGKWVVRVEPRLVVEIAFNDIQASPRYPGGVALRFARVKQYRPDKGPGDADTIDAVRAIFEASR